MKVFLTGATGFVGKSLCLHLLRQGHELTASVRDIQAARSTLPAAVNLVGYPVKATHLRHQDAVINLAGAPVVGRRWSTSYKQQLVSSRVDLTGELVRCAQELDNPPGVLLSASAIGIYGNRTERDVAETSALGSDFLANLCKDWEAASTSYPGRVACMRIGIVVGAGGGIVAELSPLFRKGLGAVIGSGKQALSWIHIDDLCRLFSEALENPSYQGPINAVGPASCSNRDFSLALGQSFGKSVRLRVPAFALKVRFGEAARVVLADQSVVPAKLQQLGFEFTYRDLGPALQDAVGTNVNVHIGPLAVRPAGDYCQRKKPIYELRTKHVIDAPLSEVFGFFSAAENLGTVTPPELDFVIVTPTPIEMEEGAQIDYRIKLGVIPMKWRTVIERWQPGHAFVDTQAKGPYRAWWHEHKFTAQGNQTVMTDTVCYAPPLGWLGRIAHALFIKRQLKRIFRYRAQTMAQRFGLQDELSADNSKTVVPLRNAQGEA